ncbi:MAG: ATP synthase F1 subunit gamma [Candidatus Hydrogenedentota bacterium]
MPSVRDIKRRIRSVKNIQQITKAMKIVAATKLRKAQEAILRARPYAIALENLIARLAKRVDHSKHPLLHIPEKRGQIGIMVITGDRGLCGSFNANIIRKTLYFLENETKDKEVELLLIGRKGYDYFKRRKYKIRDYYANFFEELSYANAIAITDKLCDFFLQHHFDEVYLIYNWFKSVLTQQVLVQKILPIEPVKIEETELMNIDYLYEPSIDKVLEKLIPRYLVVEVWRCLLESVSAEHAARMTAMENATKNACEMIDKLTLTFNRARQASITKEMCEIVAGVEALKG